MSLDRCAQRGQNSSVQDRRILCVIFQRFQMLQFKCIFWIVFLCFQEKMAWGGEERGEGLLSLGAGWRGRGRGRVSVLGGGGGGGYGE